jgi:hypothetical protein
MVAEVQFCWAHVVLVVIDRYVFWCQYEDHKKPLNQDGNIHNPLICTHSNVFRKSKIL